jgi:hypothetical protein
MMVMMKSCFEIDFLLDLPVLRSVPVVVSCGVIVVTGFRVSSLWDWWLWLLIISRFRWLEVILNVVRVAGGSLRVLSPCLQWSMAGCILETHAKRSLGECLILSSMGISNIRWSWYLISSACWYRAHTAACDLI